MVKPEFWDDEKLAKISRDARLTFIGLWNYSDDYGVVKGNTTWLKNKIYPYDDSLMLKTFEKWIDELKSMQMVLPFKNGCEDYFFIKNFLKHQSINRPSSLRNPPPPDTIIEDSLSAHGVLPAKTEDKQKEKQKENRACVWPKNFILSDEMRAYAMANGIDRSKIDDFFADFRDWSEAKGATYKDWNAAFKTRVRKAQEYGKQFLAIPGVPQKKTTTEQDDLERWKKQIGMTR